VGGSSEYDNVLSGSIKDDEFLEKISVLIPSQQWPCSIELRS
jgi:hypothetical protein